MLLRTKPPCCYELNLTSGILPATPPTPVISIRSSAAECMAPAYVSIRQRHTSAYVSIHQHTSAYVSIRQHPSAYVSIRQHTSAYVSIRQHPSGYLSIRQHPSGYVSICQHMTAYVSIRQHTSECMAPARNRKHVISACLRTYETHALKEAVGNGPAVGSRQQ